MIRRDFFKAIAAASAAICAGRGAVAASPARKPTAPSSARPLPKVAKKSPTLEEDPQAFIRELLKKAAAVSFHRVAKVGDLVVMEVEYVYDEQGRYKVNLNEELKQYLPDTAVIQTCEVTCELREDLVDCTFHLGSREYAPRVEPENRINIRWLCV